MAVLQLDGRRLACEPGSMIDERPRFILESKIVALGPYVDRREHERLVLRTVGSVDWFSFAEVDEFRFDPVSGQLRGMALRVPEHLRPAETCGTDWMDLEEFRAAPRLVDIENFQVATTAFSVFDRGALICCREGFDAEVPDRGRVVIAPGLSLLTSGGDYMGWRLDDAVSVLAGSDDQCPPGVGGEELSRELGEYLTLTSAPCLDAIIDGDRHVLRVLEEMSRRLRSGVGRESCRDILVTQIERLIADWY